MGRGDGKWRQGLLYMRNKICFFLIYLNPFIRENMKESIALKQFLQQEAQQQAESCNPEDYLQHEMHETSVQISGDGKSAFRLSEKLWQGREGSCSDQDADEICHGGTGWIYSRIFPNKQASMYIDIVDMTRKL